MRHGVYITGWLILANGCSGGGITLGSRLAGRYEGVSDYENVKFEVEMTSGDTVRVAIDKPTSEKIKRLIVRRFEGTNCDSRSENEGTLISEDPKTSSWTDSSADPAQSYCYKAFMYDARGQAVTRTVVKPAVGDPKAGQLEFEDFGEGRITLKHQAPKFDGYDGVELRRYTVDDCGKAAASAGKLLPLGRESPSLVDTDIQLGQAYCYKVFWYSRLGEVVSSSVSYPLYETGTLALKEIQNQRISLSISPAKKADFVTFELRRFQSFVCDSQDPSQGALLSEDASITAFEDKDLPLGSPFCYRASWWDRIGNKSKSTVLYAGIPPRAGSITMSGKSLRTISLSLTGSPDPSVAKVLVKRHTEGACAVRTPSDGTEVFFLPGSTAITDASLSFTTPYCYRAYWFDAFGNFSAGTTPQTYSGTGPTGGLLSVGLYNDNPPGITLSHIAPTSAEYSAVDLRRYQAPDCSSQTAAAGQSLTPFGLSDVGYGDSGLSLGTAYCYKIFWYDSFGNVQSQALNLDVSFGTASLGISSVEPGKINLAINTNLSRPAPSFRLLRFLSSSCAASDPSQGSQLSTDGTITTFTDSGRIVGQDYCYRALWSDPIGNVTSASVAYSKNGPAPGTIAITNLSSRAITLSLTQSAGPHLDRVVLRRYAESSCSSKGPAEGVDVSVGLTATSIVDQNLDLSTPYCYKIFWYDGLGNVSSAYTTDPYLGSGPVPGSIAISQYGPQSISLSHTPSISPAPLYDHVVLKRYDQASCSTETVDRGTTVPLSSSQSSLTDSGLALGTPYCYKAFWFDSFGNQSSASVPTPYAMQLPQGGDLQISSITDQAIHLGITVPPAANPANSVYDHVILRRLSQSSCNGAGMDAGTSVSLSKDTTSVVDSGLALDTPYCYKIFWRDVFGNSSSDTVAYDGLAPSAGGLTISHLSNQTVHLAITQSSDVKFTRFRLERHLATSCSSAARGTGQSLTVTTSTVSLSDAALALDTAYCYRAFWLDDFGNFSSASAAYGGTGPQGGELRATGRSHNTIAFDLTLPTTAHYKDFALRRYSGDSCSGADQNTGVLASTGTTATHVLDTGLAADTQYCYKIFWADSFGNGRSQLVSSQSVPTRTVAQLDTNCVTYSPSQQSTYIAGTYNKHPLITQHVTIGAPCSAPASWEDAGVNEAKPAFLSTNWSSGSAFLFSGTFAPDARHQVSSTPLLYDWSINIDGNQNVEMPLLRVVDGASTAYVAPADISLVDNTLASTSGSATVHNLYDGNQVSLKYLAGNAGQDVTSSLGSVAFGTDTDIPGLSYVASGSGVGPYMEETSGSYSAGTAQGGYRLLWDYGSLDQGDYFIRTKPFLQIDGAYIYGPASRTKVTLSDVGGESILTSGTDIGYSVYFGSERDNYLPDLTIGQEIVNSSYKDIHGLIYPALNNNTKQYIGSATTQHSANSALVLSKNFGSDGREEVTTTSGVNSTHMGIVSLPSEAEGISSRWLTIGNENVGSSAMLVLSGWNFQDNSFSSQALTRQYRLELKEHPTNEVYSSKFGAFGISDAYQDRARGDGVWRHGLAFFAKEDSNNSSGKIYVTALRSKPIPSTVDPEDYSIKISRYFDLVPYPNSGDTSPKQHIPSIEISNGVPDTTQFVRILSQDESGNSPAETFFYVGWRTGPDDHSFADVHLARLSSQIGSSSVPIAYNSVSPLKLYSSDPAIPGQAFYTMATGTDDDGGHLLAVAFAPFSAQKKNQCGLRIYKWNSPNLEQIGSDLVMSSYADSTFCVYPSIFFERDKKIFHVLTTKLADSSGTGADTHYRKFSINVSGVTPTVALVNPYEVPVTQPLSGQVLCGFTAAFKESGTTEMASRLSWVRVEGASACSNSDAKIRFDTYKIQR